MTERPWEVIRTAADLVEGLASAWVDGNTRVEARAAKGWGRSPREEGAYSWDQMVSGLVDDYFDEACDAAEKWTLALSPAVAGPLAAWLRSSADTWENWGSRSLEPALDFARALLDSTPR